MAETREPYETGDRGADDHLSEREVAVRTAQQILAGPTIAVPRSLLAYLLGCLGDAMTALERVLAEAEAEGASLDRDIAPDEEGDAQQATNEEAGARPDGWPR